MLLTQLPPCSRVSVIVVSPLATCAYPHSKIGPCWITKIGAEAVRFAVLLPGILMYRFALGVPPTVEHLGEWDCRRSIGPPSARRR